ncbi:uncharacterized protein H6S33_009067 [Morchella sextelata]|uniref:uncharacterized protein n=1 Tax=Morchella sextelata TaxID=1174677 RepID=UPI001D039811|nr:uncharacterized protein H6S33_009067 [Morchella sextelata]KAH0612687.1 hypothetical protein H6S33_009067 [Morchella sextelata]
MLGVWDLVQGWGCLGVLGTDKNEEYAEGEGHNAPEEEEVKVQGESGRKASRPCLLAFLLLRGGPVHRAGGHAECCLCGSYSMLYYSWIHGRMVMDD